MPRSEPPDPNFDHAIVRDELSENRTSGADLLPGARRPQLFADNGEAAAALTRDYRVDPLSPT